MKILCYDESHMLSTPAQNALLQALEEGNPDTLFIFCTTESQKMLPTIRSRCVITRMKLLSTKDIRERLSDVALQEGCELEEKAARLMATYVRGHVRDALILLEQLMRLSDSETVTEELVRTYLRLDKNDDIYQLLTTESEAEGTEQLEKLLCDYAVSELTELAGTILVNGHKVGLGLNNFTQTDEAWLKRVHQIHGASALMKAERLLMLPSSFATITFGEAAIGRILWGSPQDPTSEQKDKPAWDGAQTSHLRKRPTT